jgi:hypothetical protein
MAMKSGNVTMIAIVLRLLCSGSDIYIEILLACLYVPLR